MFNQDKNGIFSITRGDSGFISCIYNKEGVENPTVVYDTRNSTASAEDIKLGKIAYNENGKVVGTYELNLIEKTINENGTYRASLDGVEGYDTVVVDVLSTIAGQVVSGTAVNLTARDLYGATKIDEYKFYRNEIIQSIVCPDTLTEIRQLAFANASNLNEIIFNDGLTKIANSVFSGTRLVNVVIPDSVTYIGASSFSALSTLRSVKIGNGQVLIENSAFSYNNNLKTVEIGTHVTDIYPWAFGGCSSLQYVIIRATTPPVLAATSAFTSTNNCPIYVPNDSVDAYKGATNWSSFASRIHPLSEIEGA